MAPTHRPDADNAGDRRDLDAGELGSRAQSAGEEAGVHLDHEVRELWDAGPAARDDFRLELPGTRLGYRLMAGPKLLLMSGLQAPGLCVGYKTPALHPLLLLPTATTATAKKLDFSPQNNQ